MGGIRKNNNYKNFKYSNDILKLLETIRLTQEEEEKIQYWKDNLNNRFVAASTEIYKFYKLNISTSDIADIYGINIRTVQVMFKILGLHRTREEAQQIAAKKRDYSEIRKTYKRTMLDRLTTNQLSGTMIEQYIRHEIDLILGSELKECEIIIGINSMNIVGLETDIPIIIIKGKYLFKFIIEVDGVIFHETPNKKRSDITKDQIAINKGYTVFRLSTKSYYSSDDNPELRYKKEIKSKIEEIIEVIINKVNSDPELMFG